MGWDKGIDYDFYRGWFERNLKHTRSDKRYAYTAILYTQLLNGSRISEAVRAIMEFVKTGSRELKVRLSKRRRDDHRLIIVPELIDRNRCIWICDIGEDRIVKRVKTFCRAKYHVNTHSLRYSFITHLLKINVNPSIIAKITKHSKLDFILTYTQEKEAEKILRENVKEWES
jgi:integrase